MKPKRRRGFRIQITRVGYLFILLCLGVGVAGLNTGNNLLYLIFSMMLSFLILSGLLSNNSLWDLRVHATFPDRIFAKQSVAVKLELENRKRRLPSFSITLKTQEGGIESRSPVFLMKIPPLGRAGVVDHLAFPHRGKQALPDYQVETSYPFGLIRKYLPVPSEGETIVYPELLSVDPWIDADRRLHGEYLSGQTGGAANPYGIRDFAPGDAARLIHWKSSARLGTLKSREFEKEKRLRIELQLRLSLNAEAEMTEKAVSATASLLLTLSGRGYEVSLQINGTKIEPTGRGYLDAYLTALALATPSSNAIPFTTSTPDRPIILISNSNISSEQTSAFIGPRELSAA